MHTTHRTSPLLTLLIPLLVLAACEDDSPQTSPAPSATSTSSTTPAADAGEDTTQDAQDEDTHEGDVADADVDLDTDSDADTETPNPLDEALDPNTLNTIDEAFEAVDPFLGSGGQGYAYAALTPAAQRPLGFVKLGPDTTNGGLHSAQLHHFSGYYFDDPHIRGFSHTHFVGTGVADYGNLRILPLKTEDIDSERPWRTWATSDKTSEDASPGYYTVHMSDTDIRAELSAGLFVGLHRYTFGTQGNYTLRIDPASSVRDNGVEASETNVLEDGTVEGWVRYKGGYVGRSRAFTLYFTIHPSSPPTETSTWNDDGVQSDETRSTGTMTGALLRYTTVEANEQLELRVGISLISLEQAQRNLDAEAPEGSNVDTARAQARTEWENILGRVQVAGGRVRERNLFFSSLYNAYRMPSRLDETGGLYRGIDGEVHTLPENQSAHVTDLSLWDSFRTLHPWYTLTDPNAQKVCLQSLMRMTEQGGSMPRWPAALSYTGGMIGRSADVLFAESFLKGIDGVDYTAALDVLLAEALPAQDDPEGEPLLKSIETYGYAPSDLHDQSVSESLEHLYHDTALSLLARGLGRPEEADRLDARAATYTNLFDPATLHFQPRTRDGSFPNPDTFSPISFYDREGPYTEGSAAQWFFYLPNNPQGLVDLLGSRDLFLSRLEEFFTDSNIQSGNPAFRALPDSAYWHGNQPSLHVTSFFALLGERERLSFWSRIVQTSAYDATPAGLPGNDDGGTLSAWYLFSSLGLFPLPGTANYTIHPPLFTRAVLKLSPTQTLTIEAPNASPNTPPDLSSILLNGNTLADPPIITHEDLTREDATLIFE